MFLQQNLSNSVITPKTTAQLIGLYRRRDESLGQAFAAQGRTELTSREQHWAAPVQLAASAAQSMATAGYIPIPRFPTDKKKEKVDPTQIDTRKTTQKETNSKRMMKVRRGVGSLLQVYLSIRKTGP